MDSPALQVAALSVASGQRRALEEATFSVPRGAMLGVVCPNGGGKSTLKKPSAASPPMKKDASSFSDAR